jgi:hypothetical protein
MRAQVKIERGIISLKRLKITGSIPGWSATLVLPRKGGSFLFAFHIPHLRFSLSNFSKISPSNRCPLYNTPLVEKSEREVQKGKKTERGESRELEGLLQIFEEF